MATPLSSIVLRASDDPVKTDLEVICELCDQVLCDAEHGDNLSTLASVAADHTCPGVSPEPARLTQDGRAELVATIRALDTPAHGDAAWRAGLLAAARVVETTPISGVPEAADLNSALGRVREYLRQFARLRDTGGTIHDAFTDPEAESARLTANDLRVLLRAASPRGEDDEVTLRVAGGKAQITTTDDGDLRVYVTADKGSYAQCAVLPQSPGTVVLRLL